MKVNYAIFIASYFLLSGCSSTNDKKHNESLDASFEDIYSIEKVRDKMILLDSMTSVDKIGYSIYENLKQKRQYFFVLNHLDNTLQKYDWVSKSLLSRDKLEIEGPNGVGNPISLLVASEDSIYILASFQRKLTLINKEGNVLHRFILNEDSNQKNSLGTGVFPIGDIANRMAITDNKIIIGGSPFDDFLLKSYYEKGQVGIVLDRQSKSIDYIMPMPIYFTEKLKEGVFFSHQQSKPGLSYNPRKNVAVINFLTDQYIYEVDLVSKKISSHYAGSKQFKNIELSKKSFEDAKRELDYFPKQPNFSEIFYDKYRNIYLRFVCMPNPKKVDMNDGKSWWNISVILLDASFKKIGEVALDPDYRRGETIICEEGIYIRKYKESETELIFTLFKLQKKDA